MICLFRTQPITNNNNNIKIFNSLCFSIWMGETARVHVAISILNETTLINKTKFLNAFSFCITYFFCSFTLFTISWEKIFCVVKMEDGFKIHVIPIGSHLSFVNHHSTFFLVSCFHLQISISFFPQTNLLIYLLRLLLLFYFHFGT